MIWPRWSRYPWRFLTARHGTQMPIRFSRGFSTSWRGMLRWLVRLRTVVHFRCLRRPWRVSASSPKRVTLVSLRLARTPLCLSRHPIRGDRSHVLVCHCLHPVRSGHLVQRFPRLHSVPLIRISPICRQIRIRCRPPAPCPHRRAIRSSSTLRQPSQERSRRACTNHR